MSGAVNQARRRSIDNQTVDENVTEEGWSFEVRVADAEAINDELKKPACFGMALKRRKEFSGSSCNATGIFSSDESERLCLIYKRVQRV
jgi:hypothetical protein